MLKSFGGNIIRLKIYDMIFGDVKNVRYHLQSNNVWPKYGPEIVFGVIKSFG